jgi:D-alanyl-lipoteichoic acid acyltransferase DltB (MBOAT superfamily)
VLFTQPVFAAFLAVVLVVHWKVLRRGVHRRVWLLVASAVFYAWWDVRFVALVAGATLVNYAIGRMLGSTIRHAPAQARWWLRLGVVFNLAVLGLYKYLGFFADSLASLMRAAGMEVSDLTLRLTLPVAISFFTFEAISYQIDIHRGKLLPERNLLDFSLFVMFFPRLVSGPIIRPAEFLPQLRTERTVADIAWRDAATRVVIGFVKKAVIADTIGLEVDRLWREPGAFSGVAVLLVVVLYAVQIYCDFSGYTDMALGVAQMLGYRLPENFDRPYSSRSIDEFWRRWHMSLSSWLRDYLYIPLGGNRRGVRRTYANLAITMVLGGLWHGAAWTFVVWGAFHGGALALHRWRAGVARRAGREPLGERHPDLAQVGTFGLVCLGWIFFRAPSLAVAFTVIGRAVRPWVDGKGIDIVILPYLAVALTGHLVGRYLHRTERLHRVDGTRLAMALGVALGVAILLVPSASPPFIYFQF